MNKLRHVVVCVLALFVILGVPTLKYVDLSAAFSGGTDAVTQATGEIPDAPSGEFIVLINEEKHGDTLDQWETFFSGGDAGVILEDIDCMVVNYDATGIQLAERFQQRLPANQMTVKKQDGTLLVSKTQEKAFDIVILSKEIGDVYSIDTVKDSGDISWIDIREEE
ncbi:MAG: hypothetical protein IJ070_02520 [Firmicutes bacterium]|nr:hypothetical protein [Bacillota bacterium]MBQ9707617.1 hypothetical protein [Bacillota bacterium]